MPFSVWIYLSFAVAPLESQHGGDYGFWYLGRSGSPNSGNSDAPPYSLANYGHSAGIRCLGLPGSGTISEVLLCLV